MAKNVITAVFGALHETKVRPRYQYDHGQILRFRGVALPDFYEVHFANVGSTADAQRRIGNADGVEIPDEYYQSGADIIAWMYLHEDNADGETEYRVRIPIIKRNRPADSNPTPEQQDVVEQAIYYLNTAVDEAQEAAESSQNDALMAKSYAVGDTDTRPGEDTDNAKYYAEEAEISKNTAISNADSARDYASMAANSAHSAQVLAGAASLSASRAATSATNAAASETAAATSETNAAASAEAAAQNATTAASSASDAAGSASAAAGSASAASTSEGNAAASATDAAASATAAAGSESSVAQDAAAAAASAAAAATSETNAAASAAAAQVVLDSIPEDYTELSEDVNTLNGTVDYIESVSVGENLIGNEGNVLYPCFIPKGTPYVNICTSDGSNFAPVRATTMKLIAYNANKVALDSGWTLSTSRSYVDANFGRYYSDVDVYYLSLNVANNVPLMVTVQDSAVGSGVDYVPYFLNTQELNGKVNGINSRLSKLEWQIPSYYETHIESKSSSILALDNVDIQVGFITDEHFPSNAKNSPDLLHYLWEKVPIDFIINNGDVLTQAASKAEAMQFITNFNQLFGFAGDNYYPVIGNHEHNNASGGSTSTQLSLKQVQLSSYSKIRHVVFGGYTAYYFDDDMTKCRYYFVGTKQNSQLYDEDVGWVIHSFLTIPDGYGVVIFSHAGLKYDENYVVTGVQVKVNSICNALLALANKASNYHSTIGASEYLDFSTVNAIPVAVFSGHVHFDGYYQYTTSAYNGYIYVIATTCDAYGSQVVGSVDRTAGTANEQAFDIISINKTDRLITMTRIGGGSDRTFTYSDYQA